MRLAWDAAATDGEAATAFLKAKMLKLRVQSISDISSTPPPPLTEGWYRGSVDGISCFWTHQVAGAVSRAATAYFLRHEVQFEPFDGLSVVFTMKVACWGEQGRCDKFASFIENYLSPAIYKLAKDHSTHMNPDVRLPDWTDIMLDEMKAWQAENSG